MIASCFSPVGCRTVEKGEAVEAVETDKECNDSIAGCFSHGGYRTVEGEAVEAVETDKERNDSPQRTCSFEVRHSTMDALQDSSRDGRLTVSRGEPWHVL